MATLAEIRARLKSQEVNRSTSSTGGDNAIYPHWNIQENQEAVVRFLPDKDPGPGGFETGAGTSAMHGDVWRNLPSSNRS
jgi:hypothetical protein